MFGTKSTSSLVARSKSIANTFTTTLANLRAVNEEIAEADSVIALKQAELQEERDQLIETMKTNEKMAQKIEDFLG